MLNGTRPGRVIFDDLHSKPATRDELANLFKQPTTTAEEVRRQLRCRTQQPLTVVIDEVVKLKPLTIKRLPITTLKLAREIGKSHGAECKCIVCRLPKGPKTGRFKQLYGG